MIQVQGIPVFDDNYVWVATRAGQPGAVVVDPGDGVPVLRHLREHGLELTAVLLTHHHADHTGGVPELAGGDVPVYGPARPGLPFVTDPVDGGATIELLGTAVFVLATPGHTRDHVAYAGPGFVFTGDTVFTGGCGRLFEGTAEQMFDSIERIAALAPDTRVYCGHEYTLANLRFASLVEPGNAALQKRLAEVGESRRKALPTVPSALSVELATNPFLRCRVPEVVAAASRHAGRPVEPGAATLGIIRRWKDGWR